MPKAEWGTKHSCTACTAKFYDLNRSPPYCPHAGLSSPWKAAIRRPPAEQDDSAAVDDDADVTIETDDDVEGEEDPRSRD